MSTTKFVVRGTTQPLIDGVTRDVTLVALVDIEDVYDVVRNSNTKQHGATKTTVSTEKRILIDSRMTIHFGLAVLSPTDIALQERANNALSEAKIALNALMQPAMAKDKDTLAEWKKAVQAAKGKVAELTSKANIVSPMRGESIAVGKASSKSKLATICATGGFYTKHMIRSMLNEKLKHICTDPNQFIRIAPPKTTPPTGVASEAELHAVA